jgi:hypothetical protein
MDTEPLTQAELNSLKWINFVERMKPWFENAMKDGSGYTAQNVCAKVLGTMELLEDAPDKRPWFGGRQSDDSRT